MMATVPAPCVSLPVLPDMLRTDFFSRALRLPRALMRLRDSCPPTSGGGVLSSNFGEVRMQGLRSWDRAGRAVFLAAVMVAGVSLQAQGQTGTVRGTVTTVTGQPLANAQVFVVRNTLGAQTGADGGYVIARIPAGVTTIRARAIGYESTERTVTLAAGLTLVVNFSIKSSPVSLDQVVVTGTAGSARKREVGNSISQVSTADLPEVPTNVSNLLAGRVAEIGRAHV